jgi:phage replication-related protein YjqB (UPF0714/DUF867 family)
MAKKPTVTTVQSGYTSQEAINENFQNVRDAFDNTLSLDGSTPNAMNADLDMNGNSIINADTILVGGTDYLAQALRDIPQQAGFPTDITWPIKPE